MTFMISGFIFQSVNMLDYPSFTFKDDEGIYAGQAWAVLRLGQLTPYTYFYDHAPGGWLLAAGWMGLTGGVHAFGNSVDSGRVLVLVLHLAMIPLIFQITCRLGGNLVSAGLATALFSFSPLAIFYQRMFLLDNIMMFWLFLSPYLLLDEKGRLSHVVLSGITFGVALVTKETAIFLLPVIALIVWRQRRSHQSIFAVYSWFIPMVMVVSWYPFYAILKGELLGAGQAFNFFLGTPSGSGQGVSLVDALKWQSTRGGGGLFNFENLFWQLVRNDWFRRDPFLLTAGSAAIIFSLIFGLVRRNWLVPGLLGLMPLIYLARGGIVFDYYILFLIPFLCVNLGLVLGALLKWLPGKRASLVTGAITLALLIFYAASGSLLPLYTEHPDAAGRQALTWIKQNIPPSSYIITRDDLWADLHEQGLQGDSFPDAHSHWKVAADPAVRVSIFKDNWQNVDYLIMSPGLIQSLTDTNNTVALEALKHATLIKTWESAPGNTGLHPQQFIELWKVNKPVTNVQAPGKASPAPVLPLFQSVQLQPGITGKTTREVWDSFVRRLEIITESSSTN
jgi:hypothetical protein